MCVLTKTKNSGQKKKAPIENVYDLHAHFAAHILWLPIWKLRAAHWHCAMMSSIQIFITTNMYILHIRMRAAQSGQYCRHPSTHTVPAHIWPPILFIIDCICAIRGSESIYRKPMHIALCNGFCWRVSIYRAFYTGEMFFIMWTRTAHVLHFRFLHVNLVGLC